MKPFRVVYCDPPWEFRNKKTGGSHTSGAAQKYPVLDLRAICNLPIQSVMAASSLLALWVPAPLSVNEAPQVVRAWGYQFKAKSYWHKAKPSGETAHLGTGHWGRNEIEELWICTKGDVEPWRTAERNVHRTPRLKPHSTKPPWFRRMLERRETGPYLELFARQFKTGPAWEAKESWTAVGKEIDGKDIRTALRDLALCISLTTSAPGR